jgi:hypothetical protein
MKIYLAEIEAGNYTLTTWATTEKEACETLGKEWRKLEKMGRVSTPWSEKAGWVSITELTQNVVDWR